MILVAEDNIREFQEIINGQNFENFEEPEKNLKQKNENQTLILFLTSVIGLFFLATILIWTLLYIYFSQGREGENSNSKTRAQSLKVPGIEGLVMDPYPEIGGNQKIKVWALRTAVPPTAIIGDYSHFFSSSSDENNKSDF